MNISETQSMEISCWVKIEPKTDTVEIFSEENLYLAEIRGRDNFVRFAKKHKLKVLNKELIAA